MHPGVINHLSPVSSFVPVPFAVLSRFSILGKVVFEGTRNKVVGISQMSR